MTILDEITAYKREFVATLQSEAPAAAVAERARAAVARGPCQGFARALRGTRSADGTREAQSTLRVVAEIKRASPSRGVIREDFDPPAHARSYEAGGAAAISVLTDEKYFQGSLGALIRARGASSLPILRKEFMIDPYQVNEARAAGADAILLIAGLIPWAAQRELRELAGELGLDVLIEIHKAADLDDALALAPDVLGINNRDLRTRELTTDLSQTENLISRVPASQTVISESGIRDREDTLRLAGLGVDGILVGEHLMREADPGGAIAEKLGVGPHAAAMR